MNIENNNKLFTDFLGSRVTVDTFFINGMYVTEKLENLKFQSDWNYLMEVVEKIERLGYHIRFYWNSGIKKNVCFIEKEYNSYNYIGNGLSIKKIEAVYNACLEFIKWYNTTL